VTGYAVGLPGDRDAAGEPVLYSGGRLGPDLTLPRLRQRWSDGSCTGIGPADRVTALQAATHEANAARLSLRHLGHVGTEHVASRAAEEGLLAATGDALVAAALSLEGPLRGPLTQAAARFERAGQIPRRTLHASVAGHALSRAARDLARAGVARPGAERQAALDMVHALVRLTEAVARLHQLRNRPHAAQAAALSASALQRWQHPATVLFAGPPTRPAPRRALPSEPLASPRAAPQGRGGNS